MLHWSLTHVTCVPYRTRHHWLFEFVVSSLCADRFFSPCTNVFPGFPFSPKHSPLSFPPKPPLTIMEDLTAEIPQHLELTRILENKDQDFNKSNPIVMDVNGLTGQLMSVCPAHANSTTYLSIHIPLLLFFLVKRTLTLLIQFIQT